MKIDLYKVTQSRDTYLGFIEQENVPSKGDIIHYLGHDYKVIHIERCSFPNTVWVKLVN